MLQVSDIFVQPSLVLGLRQEGTPVAVLEAVGPRSNDCDEHRWSLRIAEQSKARIVEPKDVESLKNVIDELIMDPTQRKTMTAAHLAFAQQMCWSRLGPVHGQLISESIARFRCEVPR